MFCFHHLRIMPATLTAYARVVLEPTHLQRTLLIAFVTGSLLNLFNLTDQLLQGGLTAHLAAKAAFNYLIPFIVSNVGLLSHQRR